MSKLPIVGWIHEPVAAVLGTRGKVAVLRVLAQAQTPLPQREVARRTGMALRTVELALDDLLITGIVERLAGGRERLVRFRSGHRLTPAVQALLRAGADQWPALRGELRALAASGNDSKLLAVVVVGPVARREERLGQPIELLIVAEDVATAERWVARYHETEDGLAARFGVGVMAVGHDISSAKAMWATHTSPPGRSLDEAELIHGRSLAELLG